MGAARIRAATRRTRGRNSPAHHGAPDAGAVERLGTTAIRTYEQLVRAGRTYGPDDLRRVAAQAYGLLRR